MKWEITHSCLSGYSEPFNGFSGGPGDKVLIKFTIFSSKLVSYSLLEIIKLKLERLDDLIKSTTK